MDKIEQSTMKNIEQVQIPKELLTLTEDLAEHVHNTWVSGRIKDGWIFGVERNDKNKTHPCLVPYAELSEEEKEYDRKTSQETIRFILSRGFSFVR